MNRKGLFITLLILVFLLTGCGSESASANGTEVKEIHISAAASLTDPLTEIQTEFEKSNDVILLINFAASGTLYKQIKEGAPCDLFISASRSHMDSLEEEGAIDSSSRIDLLGNTLTLISSEEKADIMEGLDSLTSADIESISIGMPDSVPAGKYAQQALESTDVLEEIRQKIVYAKDVRQVLEYVETGNVDCGIVYKSDAVNLKTSIIIQDIPDEYHSAILYPAALIENSADTETAEKFYYFLQTEYAKGIFQKYGFKVL